MMPGSQGSSLTHTWRNPAAPGWESGLVYLICEYLKGMSKLGWEENSERVSWPMATSPRFWDLMHAFWVCAGKGGLSMTLGHKKALSSYLNTLCTTTQARRKNHPSINIQETQLPSLPPVFIGSGLTGKQGPLPLFRWTDNSWSGHIFRKDQPQNLGSSLLHPPAKGLGFQPAFLFLPQN